MSEDHTDIDAEVMRWTASRKAEVRENSGPRTTNNKTV
jgi:hypothetical protein